jgi:hypothetical protein
MLWGGELKLVVLSVVEGVNAFIPQRVLLRLTQMLIGARFHGSLLLFFAAQGFPPGMRFRIDPPLIDLIIPLPIQ